MYLINLKHVYATLPIWGPKDNEQSKPLKQAFKNTQYKNNLKTTTMK